MYYGLSELHDLPKIAAPCWLVDVSSEKFLRVSEPAVALLGYSEPELQEMTTSDIVHPEHRHKVVERRQEAREKWGEGSEWLCMRPNGSCFNMKLRFQIVNYRGTSAYFAFVTEWKDVTD